MTNKYLSNSDQKLAILIDPESHEPSELTSFIKTVVDAQPDLILVGGSYIASSCIDGCIKEIKAITNIPVILFPGHMNQMSIHSDALLLLSLISGRNPDLLIGQHVLAAPALSKIKERVIPTGYILIDGGVSTSVSYISNTSPIPSGKIQLVASTAMAGELLGLKQIYLDAGSGALNPISTSTIRAVKSSIQLPLIVGGGIRTRAQAKNAWEAGANLVVIGNVIEENRDSIKSFAKNGMMSEKPLNV
tara:strand:+ start:537 stop:1277 length:741 start_codon:yes stop_codon:yes gene_type:complete